MGIANSKKLNYWVLNWPNRPVHTSEWIGKWSGSVMKYLLDKDIKTNIWAVGIDNIYGIGKAL
jgi:hypothetical protein